VSEGCAAGKYRITRSEHKFGPEKSVINACKVASSSRKPKTGKETYPPLIWHSWAWNW